MNPNNINKKDLSKMCAIISIASLQTIIMFCILSVFFAKGFLPGLMCLLFALAVEGCIDFLFFRDC
jgi:hypothetical protein